jgi:hypothetical protein
VHPNQYIFPFLDGAKVASIPKQNLIQLTTLFQETLKIWNNRHRCNNAFTLKIFKNYF